MIFNMCAFNNNQNSSVQFQVEIWVDNSLKSVVLRETPIVVTFAKWNWMSYNQSFFFQQIHAFEKNLHSILNVILIFFIQI